MKNDSLKVIRVKPYGKEVFELTLERAAWTFTPGDCVNLFEESGREGRPYSLASGVDEDVLRFVIRSMPGGCVSPWLAARKTGDSVWASPPFGWFRPGQAPGQAPCVFMATGTGITPFLSFLRSFPDRKPACFRVGLRTTEEAVERAWLEERAGAEFFFSRETASGARSGRITTALEEIPLGPEHQYYLCGLDAMIDQMASWLQTREIPVRHIHRECFFNTDAAPAT